MKTLVALAVAMVLGVAATAQADSILYDNGAALEADNGLRYNHAQYTVYDDFVLSTDATITGFEWSQFEESGVSYTSTTLTLYDAVPSATATVLATFSVAASRTSNGLELTTSKAPTDDVFGYDYDADNLSKFLSAGTYYVGIHSNVSGGVTLVANANATTDTYGFYQSITSTSGPTRYEFKGGATAFQVIGTPVPEPSTLALLGLGLAGLAWRRRRRGAGRDQ